MKRIIYATIPIGKRMIGTTNSVMAFFQVGAVNSGSKCARTAIMGLGRDIMNLLVAQIALLSASI